MQATAIGRSESGAGHVPPDQAHRPCARVFQDRLDGNVSARGEFDDLDRRASTFLIITELARSRVIGRARLVVGRIPVPLESALRVGLAVHRSLLFQSLELAA